MIDDYEESAEIPEEVWEDFHMPRRDFAPPIHVIQTKVHDDYFGKYLFDESGLDPATIIKPRPILSDSMTCTQSDIQRQPVYGESIFHTILIWKRKMDELMKMSVDKMIDRKENP